MIELEGLNEEVDEVGSGVEAALWETGATEVKVAEREAERASLWAGRKGALGALGSLAPNYYLIDGVVPPNPTEQCAAASGPDWRELRHPNRQWCSMPGTAICIHVCCSTSANPEKWKK